MQASVTVQPSSLPQGAVSPVLWGPLIIVAWVLILWLVKKFFLIRLRRWAEKTTTVWDDILIQAVSVPADLLIFATGLAILVGCLPLPKKADAFAEVLFQGAIILAIVLFLDRFIIGTMKKRAVAFFGNTSQGLTRGLIRGLIVGIGSLTFLNLIGISITPILASLGIGSLAVALALQDTLSNFFAGLYAAVDKPVKVGDFIRLESGEEGTVLDIGWRSSRIQLLSNNVVILPNSKLMGSVITNYSMPQKELSLALTFGVDYSSDLEKVERVTYRTAREVAGGAPGAVSTFDPIVRFTKFADSYIEVCVVLFAKEFTDSFTLKHELIKALHRRYREEGIKIPFPVRTVRLEGDFKPVS